MGLANPRVGAELSVEEFSEALRRIDPTPTRLKMIAAYSQRYPGYLTPHELGRALGNKTNIPHSTGNRANGEFGKRVALVLGLDQAEEGWWVGAAFETRSQRDGGVMEARPWPDLAYALATTADWSVAWADGRTKGSPNDGFVFFLDDPGRMQERLGRDRQQQFRALVLAAWNGACAISECSDAAALEAAHIDRYQNTRAHSAGNGILLRADLHRLFDAGFIRFVGDNSAWITEVHPEIHNPAYRAFDRCHLAEPDDFSWRLDSRCVEKAFKVATSRGGW